MPSPDSIIRVDYIRVDRNRKIFQAIDPGVAKVGVDDIVMDIVLQAREYTPSLKAFNMDKIKIYKLKTPVGRLPLQRSAATTRCSAGEDAKNELIKKAFEDLKRQIELFGIDNDHLDQIRFGDPLSGIFETRLGYITAVIYHPVIPEDCTCRPLFFSPATPGLSLQQMYSSLV